MSTLPKPPDGAPGTDPILGGVQTLECLRTFAAGLPGWVQANGVEAHIRIRGTTDGVEVQVGFADQDAGKREIYTNSLLDRLRDVERLQRLQLLIDEMRGAGVEALLIDPMIEEAERLIARLYPQTETIRTGS